MAAMIPTTSRRGAPSTHVAYIMVEDPMTYRVTPPSPVTLMTDCFRSLPVGSIGCWYFWARGNHVALGQETEGVDPPRLFLFAPHLLSAEAVNSLRYANMEELARLMAPAHTYFVSDPSEEPVHIADVEQYRQLVEDFARAYLSTRSLEGQPTG
jgi:hypothetical protein